MPNPVNNVTTRELDWTAEVKKIWGPKWNEPDPEYEFSNGRVFKRRIDDVASYATSPDN